MDLGAVSFGSPAFAPQRTVFLYEDGSVSLKVFPIRVGNGFETVQINEQNLVIVIWGGRVGFFLFALFDNIRLDNKDGVTSAGTGTATDPFLPISSPEPGFRFVVPVTGFVSGSFDPAIATGYDYLLNSGPNFASVMLPDIGDGIFDVMWGWDGTTFTNVSSLVAGDIFDFGGTGVNRFRVTGIETAAGLSPTDPLAFVTTLSFDATGIADFNQNPIVSNVPEPESVFLFGAGIVGLLAARRRATVSAKLS